MYSDTDFIYKSIHNFADYIKNKNIFYVSGNSNFGYYFCIFENENILNLFFINEKDLAKIISDFELKFNNSLSFLKRDINLFFDMNLEIKNKNTKFILFGTNFQLKVWRALVNISFGEKISYSVLSESINKAKSSRAVANAIGKNPISYFMPCHRIVRKDGSLGGYRWGIHIKKRMLDFEQSKAALSFPLGSSDSLHIKSDF
ncbi:methylated-DNA--[protein]-cysteine S-methyltransferase [Fluviispira multicolorata]|uniref:methylated-DNA--[protein]-cysteine S-methyltransferase n=1 Tax=Fluviispira multicolorata TaxID=2654512 RepID=A0A833JB26_9BACT|nr:methylated-DNA--[protein]-cysteine S-methyltransferase [Fluviispira multicolorata]KAB8028568.1 methylated-DNA--[protein]-cysteine S-methyltransferase [Fluviispira multicolorata]